jgi:hypothetical protein
MFFTAVTYNHKGTKASAMVRGVEVAFKNKRRFKTSSLISAVVVIYECKVFIKSITKLGLSFHLNPWNRLNWKRTFFQNLVSLKKSIFEKIMVFFKLIFYLCKILELFSK